MADPSQDVMENSESEEVFTIPSPGDSEIDESSISAAPCPTNTGQDDVIDLVETDDSDIEEGDVVCISPTPPQSSKPSSSTCNIDNVAAFVSVDSGQDSDFVPVSEELFDAYVSAQNIDEINDNLINVSKNVDGGSILSDISHSNKGGDAMGIEMGDVLTRSRCDVSEVNCNFQNTSPFYVSESATSSAVGLTIGESETQERETLIHNMYASDMFYCYICRISFDNSCGVYQHLNGVHAMNTGRPFTCDICGKGFRAKEAVSVHVSAVHRADNAYTAKCKHCQERVKGSEYMHHLESVHPDKECFTCN